MAIREITKRELKKAKSGWRYDKKREVWITWEVETNFGGKRKFKRGFLNEAAAKEYLKNVDLQNKLKEIGFVEKVKYPLVSELFAKRLADIENRHEKARAERVFKVFQSFLSLDATIDIVDKSHYKQFADHRIAEGVSKLTVNREINPISAAFSSVRDYYSGLQKWVKPAVFKFSVPQSGRTRVIDETEYQKLFAYLFADQSPKEKSHDFRARRRTGLILQFALMTGLRHGEICGMEKARLNKKLKEINVYRSKTKRWKIYSPLTPTMISLMDEGAKLYPDSEHFFSREGKLQNGFYRQLKSACEACDLVYGRYKTGGMVLHDARHTFSTFLLQNLIDNKTATEFTDNPTAISNYQHPTNAGKSRAMEIIENKFSPAEEKNIEDELRKIYESVKSGEIDYENFKNALAKNCGFSAS